MQQSLFEQIHGLVQLRDLSGRVNYVSPAVGDLLGYQSDEYARRFMELVDGSQEVNFYARSLWKQIREGSYNGPDELPAYHLEIPTKTGDNKIFAVRERFVRENGERSGLLAIGMDVTSDFRERNELLGQSRELSVTKHIQDCIANSQDESELMKTSLECILSLFDYKRGAVYQLNRTASQATLIHRQGFSSGDVEAPKSFAPPKLMLTSVADKRAKAILFAPGDTWLEPVGSIGENLTGLLLFINHAPSVLLTMTGQSEFSRQTQHLLQCVGTLLAQALQSRQQRFSPTNPDITDSVTGFYNSNFVNDFLNREENLVSRHKRSASVVMLNANEIARNFKRDSEAPWRSFGQQLTHSVRSTDLVAHYNEDALMIYLPETGRRGSEIVLDRLSKQGIFKVATKTQDKFPICSASTETSAKRLRTLVHEAAIAIATPRRKPIEI